MREKIKMKMKRRKKKAKMKMKMKALKKECQKLSLQRNKDC